MAGPVLFIVLFPLVILSSLIILLIAVGGVLGLLMMVAAVSTEKNGTLDAISRAFSYIYSRPLQFFFYYFLVFLLAYIIVLVGAGFFPGIIADPFDTGIWSGAQIEDGFAAGCVSAFKVELPDFTGLGFFSGIGSPR